MSTWSKLHAHVWTSPCFAAIKWVPIIFIKKSTNTKAAICNACADTPNCNFWTHSNKVPVIFIHKLLKNKMHHFALHVHMLQTAWYDLSRTVIHTTHNKESRGVAGSRELVVRTAWRRRCTSSRGKVDCTEWRPGLHSVARWTATPRASKMQVLCWKRPAGWMEVLLQNNQKTAVRLFCY